MLEDGPESAPYQIICEGSADRVFINKLLQFRWGVTEMAVRCTHIQDRRCAGRDALTKSMLALDAVRSTQPKAIRGIAIVFDSDDKPEDSFKDVIKSIRASKLGYPLPDKLQEVKNGKNGTPSIAVSLIPGIDRSGHLDELIFEALSESHSDLLVPIGDYQTATDHRTRDWKIGPKAKMKLRCMLAASHEPDPSVSLTWFLESSDCPVDFGHTCFDPLMNFLEDFRKKA
jgi:hypothetical protein